MAAERYVLLGLGTPRSPWFTEVARWATVGSLPAELVKCISAEEVAVRLTSGRPFSALLVDAATGAVDRDLLATAARREVAVIVVDGGTAQASWLQLGAAAVLPPDLTREQLLEALVDTSRLIGTAADLPPVADIPAPATVVAAGALVAVVGSGGTGTSTVAMALAQGLSPSPGGVVLADLCLDAEHAVLHDARDVVPGVQELLDLHRRGRPPTDEVRSLTFDVVNRGYHLLLGLRRHRDWAVLRPRTFDAALAGLRAAFGVVVADIDADVEGEAETGSIEVEERNTMARTVAERADVVVVVGTPGVKGLHGLVRTVDRLREHGVAAERTLAVVNRCPRSARGRAELTRSLAQLLSGLADDGRPAIVGPVHVAERRALDEVLRDGARLPGSVVDPLTGAVGALLACTPMAAVAAPATPVPIAPGSLGSWAEEGVG